LGDCHRNFFCLPFFLFLTFVPTPRGDTSFTVPVVFLWSLGSFFLGSSPPSGGIAYPVAPKSHNGETAKEPIGHPPQVRIGLPPYLFAVCLILSGTHHGLPAPPPPSPLCLLLVCPHSCRFEPPFVFSPTCWNSQMSIFSDLFFLMAGLVRVFFFLFSPVLPLPQKRVSFCPPYFSPSKISFSNFFCSVRGNPLFSVLCSLSHRAYGKSSPPPTWGWGTDFSQRFPSPLNPLRFLRVRPVLARYPRCGQFRFRFFTCLSLTALIFRLTPPSSLSFPGKHPHPFDGFSTLCLLPQINKGQNDVFLFYLSSGPVCCCLSASSHSFSFLHPPITPVISFEPELFLKHIILFISFSQGSTAVCIPSINVPIWRHLANLENPPGPSLALKPQSSTRDRMFAVFVFTQLLVGPCVTLHVTEVLNLVSDGFRPCGCSLSH